MSAQRGHRLSGGTGGPSADAGGDGVARESWLTQGGGEMGERLRAFDWKSNPLGPPEQWPPCLRTAVGICLSSRFPMFVWWGPELINIYNDAYIPVLGKRHPRGFGVPARPLWEEIWPVIGPQAQAVMERGEATWNERVLLVMERNNFTEETWFTWSYSPVPNETGGIGGLFCACTEDTGRVLAERERDRQMEQRRRADERARAILESITDAFFAVDGEWRFTYVNAQAERLLGCAPGDLLGRIIWKAYPGLLGTEFERVYRRAAEERVAVSVTSFYADHDRWYEVHAYPSPDGISIYFRDVSEKKRAEEQRRNLVERHGEQSRLFERMLSSITDFAYTFDLEGRFTFVNKPLLDLWGLALEEAVGKNFFDLKYPDDLAGKLQDQIRQVIETKQRVVDETEYTSPAGAIGYYQYIFSPVIGPGGIVEAVAGSTRDITRHKEIEERERRSAMEAKAAAEANAKFRTFFEQGTYFAGLMSLDGTVIEANRLCLDACGYTRGQVIGRKFWDCPWWSPSPELVEMVRLGTAEAAAGRIFQRESLYFIADGGQRHVELTLAPVKDEAGRVLFVAPTGVDITDRKRLADDRERLLVAERQSRDEAEAANRAKDRFLAVLSHELRTPLSPVAMAIPSIELDPELPFKFREDLAMIRRNIELEVKLIDDLLDLSRITSGKLRLQMQSVRAHELLRHLMRSSAAEIAGKRLSIRDELGARNDRLLADPARLQQVFWNLLRNAVKFTPEGGEIRVRTWNAEEDRRLVVEVSDNGVGITQQVLPRIFDAFEQGEVRMTHQFGGLGLGLAIAKAVVEMHGGTIGAASAGQDRGAVFTVEFETIGDRASGEGRAPEGGGAEGQRSRGSRVLIVEDHPDTARILARLLREAGYDVRTAHSAKSALQLAASEAFDLVVSDIGLPDATGYELMEQIRDGYGIKGIALSGYGMEEDMRRGREAGFVDHVVKPVNVAQLEAVIRRVLE